MELTKNELLNIQGGYKTFTTLPNFEAYRKIILWVYNTIRSWF